MKNRFTLANYKGRLVACTPRRLSPEDYPLGLFKYDIQSSDDGFDPVLIAPTIIVNHWGTMLSKKRISLDKCGYDKINNDLEFIELFLPAISLAEFIKISAEKEAELIALSYKEGNEYENYNLNI